MRNENTTFRFPENQRHRMEKLARTVPGKFVSAFFKLRFEVLGKLRSHAAVCPVGPDNQVGGVQRGNVVNPRIELELHPRRLALILQDAEQVNP